MGILRFNYRSQALAHYTNITIVYPTDSFSYFDPDALRKGRHHVPGQRPPHRYRPGMKFQTVYLIHGGGDDDSLTYRYTNAERFAQKNNVMLVTPGIPNSFGIDTEYGVPYFTFLTEELPVVVQTLFASSPRREDNFIMGYAMGGNVALGAALLRPDLYHTCVDISGGIGMTLDTKTLQDELDSDHFNHDFSLYVSSFGKSDSIEASPYNLYRAARAHKENGDALCNFCIACGSREFIRRRVEKDVQLLRELEYNVSYTCAEGYDHDFRMWNDYIEIGLDQWLPLKRAAVGPDAADGI